MAEYWETLGLTAPPDTVRALKRAFLARRKALATTADKTEQAELERAYALALSVLSYSSGEDEAEEIEADTLADDGDDGLTLDDFAPYVVPEPEPELDSLTDLQANNLLETATKAKAQQKFLPLNNDPIFSSGSSHAVLGGRAIVESIDTETNVLPDKMKEVNSNPKSSYEPPDYIIATVAGIKSFYKKRDDYETRAPRAEYWPIMLINAVLQISIVSYFLIKSHDAEFGSASLFDYFLVLFWIIYTLMHIFKLLAVSVRRLHDLGLSGFLYPLYWVILFIPLLFNPWLCLGVIALWVLLLSWPGTKGPNKFGPDPREIGL